MICKFVVYVGMHDSEIAGIFLLVVRELFKVGPANHDVVDENNHVDLVSWIRSMDSFIDPRQKIRLPPVSSHRQGIHYKCPRNLCHRNYQKRG